MKYRSKKSSVALLCSSGYCSFALFGGSKYRTLKVVLFSMFNKEEKLQLAYVCIWKILWICCVTVSLWHFQFCILALAIRKCYINASIWKYAQFLLFETVCLLSWTCIFLILLLKNIKTTGHGSCGKRKLRITWTTHQSVRISCCRWGMVLYLQISVMYFLKVTCKFLCQLIWSFN